MQLDPESGGHFIALAESLERPVNFITSEQLQQEIFNREGSRQLTMMIQDQRQKGGVLMMQDQVLNLLDLYILGTDIQPLDELGDIEDVA
jgi:hypothetical protein